LITVVEENLHPSPDRADILAVYQSEIKAKAGKTLKLLYFKNQEV
jgi:hypothetical protein